MAFLAHWPARPCTQGRFGVTLGPSTTSGRTDRASRHSSASYRAQSQAEELGFADAWSSEHIIIPRGAPYPPSALFYDPVLTLTWAAAFTKRIRLGRSEERRV